MSSFRRGERVLLSTDGIQGTAVTNLGANKLAPRFIGPFKVLKVIGDAYTLDIHTAMRLHPSFYVGCLEPYVPATIPAPEAESPRPARNPSHPAVDVDAESARALAPHARASPSVTRAGLSDERATPASIEPQQSPQQQHIRAHTKRGSEPQSRRSSPDPSPACSSGAPSDVSIRSGEAPRQSSKRPKLPKPATLKSRGSEATPSPERVTLQSRATPFTAWRTRSSSPSTRLRPPRSSPTSPRQQPRRRSTLQQCPSFYSTAKPSRGLCVTRSKPLLTDRRRMEIGEASEYFYLRMASKARL
ncbi:hypothetical protein PF003_g3157 [Phytophthora fragariae]|nr:hypothetical protein PF003_g3157 [Phytophthora fragariae]